MPFPGPLNDIEKRHKAKIADPIKELPFTLRDLKEAVPAEYFKANMLTSWYYIAKDLAQFALVAWATKMLFNLLGETSLAVTIAIFAVYGFLQGTTGFGLWVIGHECGHQAYFGNRKTLNNAVGLVIHSCMLVPFHSWRITHATHHRFTNNLQKDTAFPPYKQRFSVQDLSDSIPLFEFLHMCTYWTVGFPIYLCLNWAGQVYPSQTCNHFWPYSPIFRPSERRDVVISDIGFGLVVAALTAWSFTYGFWHMFGWYLLPWFFCNAWLTTVTLLQHSSPQVPHYDDSEWDFVRGALSTVDRDYGVFNKWMHHITDGHVAHHLFSTMPFYHAIKATPYLAKKMGPYYKTDSRPLRVQFLEAFRSHCYSYLVWLRYPDQL